MLVASRGAGCTLRPENTVVEHGNYGTDRIMTASEPKRRSIPRCMVTVALITLATLVMFELSLRGLGFLIAADDSSSRPHGDDSVYTILCVGDSWTHGLDAVSYGEALEAKLNARNDGRDYRVVRSGIPGSNSSQGLERLPTLLSGHKPDLVIALLGNNDHQNLVQSEYWNFQSKRATRFRMWSARSRVFVHSLRMYKLFRTVQLQLSGRPTLDEYFFAESTGNQQPKATAVGLEAHRGQLEYNLTRIVDVARMQDVKLVFMTYFYFHGYEVNESILDVAYAYDVPVVNNTVSFHERIPVDRRAEYFVGAHPTTNGHAFIADNIIELMDRL
jgi:hypothetical protein